MSTPTRIRTQTDEGLGPSALPLRHRGVFGSFLKGTKINLNYYEKKCIYLNQFFTLLLQVVPIVSERFTFNCFYHFHYYKNLYAVSKQLKINSHFTILLLYLLFLYSRLKYTNYLFLRAVYHGYFLFNKVIICYGRRTRTSDLQLMRLTSYHLLPSHGRCWWARTTDRLCIVIDTLNSLLNQHVFPYDNQSIPRYIYLPLV